MYWIIIWAKAVVKTFFNIFLKNIGKFLGLTYRLKETSDRGFFWEGDINEWKK